MKQDQRPKLFFVIVKRVFKVTFTLYLLWCFSFHNILLIIYESKLKNTAAKNEKCKVLYQNNLHLADKVSIYIT